MDGDGRPLILVVDDEADLAVTCERLLRRRGYTVRCVGSRAAALAALDEARPAVLVADLRLPDGDGLDVVRAAATMSPRVPVVVMTGRASERGRAAARAAGATAYLPKPFTADSLGGLVDQALAGAGG